ncbi:MAG: ABC transporter permease [Candidatus Limnocylindrales bacterium]
MSLIEETAAWLTDATHWSGAAGIPTRVIEHLVVSLSALVIAIAIALPLGLLVGHTRRGAAIAVNLANLGRALPTLAVITLVLPVTQAIDPQLGFKFYPTMIALVVLGIPPILVNTYVGVSGVDPELVESARGMGMRERQVLGRVEIPVALPILAGGIRSAATQIVATATLGAIFGGGGLGRFLVEGIAQNDDGMIFGGVTLVAVLSIATEVVFALLQRRLTSPGLAQPRFGWSSRVQPAMPSGAAEFR